MPTRRKAWARDVARALVLKTNPYPPFTALNRIPYKLALQRVIAEAGRHPAMLTLAVRQGMTKRDWVPGLSDIDVTAVLRRGLTAAEEYQAVDTFRAGYRRLKRKFPMLGELEILAEDDLAAWFRHASMSGATQDLGVLYGEPLPAGAGEPVRWRERSLNFALWIYLELLPPCVAQPPGFLRDEDVRRRTRKILRTLAWIPQEPPPADSVDLWCATAAKALESAAAALESHLSAPKPEWFPPEANHCRFTSPTSALGINGVRSAVITASKSLVILDHGLTPESIAGLIPLSDRFGPAPILVPQAVFQHMIQRYSPYDFAELYRRRKVSYGTDPLANFAPPGGAEFAAHLQDRAVDLLTFVRGEQLFDAPLTMDELRLEANRAMTFLLWRKQRWISPDRAEAAGRWPVEFPDEAQAFEQIETALREQRPEQARLSAFQWFRSISTEVRAFLENSNEPVAHSLSSGSGL